MSPRMKLLVVASECSPYVKTGGLADVVASIPQALAKQGVDVKILIPAYSSIEDNTNLNTTDFRLENLFGQPAVVRSTSIGLCDLLYLDAPHLYGRAGNPYVDQNNNDWPDNAVRFSALSAAGAELSVRGVDGWFPDVVSIHDWQTGLLPLYLKQMDQKTPPVVMTIHNIAYQGLFHPELLPTLGINHEFMHSGGLEYYGNISYLKSGINYSDWVTTVSPTYSQELMTSEFGMGLEGVLNNRADCFTGILNGIDTEEWNPATDQALEAPYSIDSLEHKHLNRKMLGDLFNLKLNQNKPLFCIVSRLADQKGLDLVIKALPELVDQEIQLIVLGKGDPQIEEQLNHSQAQYPDHVSVKIGYNETLAHQIQGGSDAILIPSRFEPCGLTQLYGLRYGTVPVVSQTGGLGDTVINANNAALRCNSATGFVFERGNKNAIVNAVKQVTHLFSDRKKWNSLVRNGMSHPVGWESSAVHYFELFNKLVDDRA